MASGYDPEIVKNASGTSGKRPLLKKPLRYDKGFSKDGDIPNYNAWTKEGNAAKFANDYGVPALVQGDPLGCGCDEAHLHAVGDITEAGLLEVDYMCDSGWHNYYVYQLHMQKNPTQNEVKIDKFGNLSADQGFKATQLGDF